MIILGIETSCDDTSISAVKINEKKQTFNVLSDKISSQIKLHAKWGGIVPNLAAREHSKNIIPILKKALKEASVSVSDINLISVTQGPGLIPSLLIGSNFAKTLSYLWRKPLMGIHHIEGHIYAGLLSSVKKNNSLDKIKFPALILIVSGGHTQLITMRHHLDYNIIGETQDDAVGEAFDKVARILDLDYPGGPIISQKASFFTKKSTFSFPRPMIDSPDLNFSFSGLKTAVLYKTKELKKHLNKKDFLKKIPEICFEFQQSCIDVLIHKTVIASKKFNPQTLILSGGVSANKELRKQFKNQFKNIQYLTPDPLYTSDNATMIALAGYFRWKNMEKSEKEKTLQNWKTLQADANLNFC